MIKKFIGQDDWHEVYEELENENLKLSVYDNFIINLMGNVNGKAVLDFGCGPGMIGQALENLNADVDVYDINKKILKIARKRLLEKNVIYNATDIDKNKYDFVLCNLVLCIVEDEQVIEITKSIYNSLKNSGIALVGFCNPKIFKIRESKLDIRHFSGEGYKKNHTYLKQKIEGGYFILEKHRPIDWYSEVFKKADFVVSKKIFTDAYFWKGKKINDFIIFKLKK